ncbi:MAG: PspC domain-containing protein [Xanthomonadales bacterium]|nr:PspC domain-containing protein [Xanthomonadales bacterium]NIN58587.1 PspC domain-containing protein [Xanthomonadales bacterium]NIN73876.1 PspC domain-containing protein [Xanthomonadales bacterium]NIO12345.1 PspC domain-containing protein [Xanthomonadales bacterium]NIP10980.1 PspC domain-containing protein [Xanthomonadales bacterium]
MNAENVIESIRKNLNGRPGQPIVLGVCSTLATRFDREPWVFRAAAIVLAVFFTLATLAVYVALGLLMKETETRTRGLFTGLVIWGREAFERCLEACGTLSGGGRTADRNGPPH